MPSSITPKFLSQQCRPISTIKATHQSTNDVANAGVLAEIATRGPETLTERSSHSHALRSHWVAAPQRPATELTSPARGPSWGSGRRGVACCVGAGEPEADWIGPEQPAQQILVVGVRMLAGLPFQPGTHQRSPLVDAFSHTVAKASHRFRRERHASPPRTHAPIPHAYATCPHAHARHPRPRQAPTTRRRGNSGGRLTS